MTEDAQLQPISTPFGVVNFVQVRISVLKDALDLVAVHNYHDYQHFHKRTNCTLRGGGK